MTNKLLFKETFYNLIHKKVDDIFSYSKRVEFLKCSKFIDECLDELEKDLTDTETVRSAKAYELLWEDKIIHSSFLQ